MSIFVDLILNDEDQTDVTSREFDAIPRVGEVVAFSLLRPWKDYSMHAAYCTVTEVQYSVRVDPELDNREGPPPIVHAFVFIAPRSDADMTALRQLFPHLEPEPSDA